MIPKLSSKELNDLFLESQSKLDNFENDINTIKKDITLKSMIMTDELEYMNSKIQLSEYVIKNVTNYNMYRLTDCENNNYEQYGSIIHPKFIEPPTNVFNLTTATNNSIFFRNDPVVYVNDTYKSEYVDVLKHDSLPKEIFFSEYESDEIKLTVSMPDPTQRLGSTIFNVIEIDSFLCGSYDIQDIVLYGLNTENELVPTYKLTDKEHPIVEAGKIRIILPNKMSLQKVEFYIKINFNLNKNGKTIYPFGLKHIYFYDADFNQYTIDTDGNTIVNSYAVLKVDCPLTEQLNSINTKLIMKDLYANNYSNDYIENVEYYAYYEDNELTGKLTTSEIQENVFPGNFSYFYAKIPLIDFEYDTDNKTTNVINKVLYSIGIDFTTR